MPLFVPCLFAVLREGNDGKMTRDVARSKTCLLYTSPNSSTKANCIVEPLQEETMVIDVLLLLVLLIPLLASRSQSQR